MAEVQESGPLVGENFTDAQWRALFGGEAAIVGDNDGSAYKLNLPTGSDVVEIGSTTQESTAVVGGFSHRIPAGATQSLTIPASSNAAVGRTDIIAVRLNQGSFTTAPGPVRLVRVPGVEGSAAAPSLNQAAPGVEDMPLYAVTRKQGQSLTQAAVRDLRRRSGPSLYVPANAALPGQVPLGTRAYRDDVEYLRYLNSSGTVEWLESPSWAPRSRRVLDLVRTSEGEFSGTTNPATPFTTLLNGSLPANAPAGLYQVVWTLTLAGSAPTTAALRGLVGGSNVTAVDGSTDTLIAVGTSRGLWTVTSLVPHSGGALSFVLSVKANGGTITALKGSRIQAVWQGPA